MHSKTERRCGLQLLRAAGGLLLLQTSTPAQRAGTGERLHRPRRDPHMRFSDGRFRGRRPDVHAGRHNGRCEEGGGREHGRAEGRERSGGAFEEFVVFVGGLNPDVVGRDASRGAVRQSSLEDGVQLPGRRNMKRDRDVVGGRGDGGNRNGELNESWSADLHAEDVAQDDELEEERPRERSGRAGAAWTARGVEEVKEVNMMGVGVVWVGIVCGKSVLGLGQGRDKSEAEMYW
ncbi:uncharacterized protein BXZ73DRAFT_79374 [Epithele typhae]|uniref:uncharacterized protein n=1 Tax=Epithele typhae TaxID=378194 RepID=UPI00200729ED|nr:uncharacterized protein BXZ73DRAFT_79374 [Epithele typhae]KAH9923978.1 hypothetical protein BXZ73DRAFT_79374 [Epithele typhae]